ncbi:Transcription factor BIM2 [Hibiscus syriacus]|uniref:Transcription factor BIM2 n=1 Tax=Hibiscus syriacus TaxID=106335 RepID=A0A6A3C9T7_HIBSY|nr:transcription factor BIM2-like [Hibiscus syriacus]KAE8724591.1 Transcription factor BIM2 [Hibiscus syriacus]
MRTGKGSQEEDEFGSKKARPSVYTVSVNANNKTDINNEADGNNTDKAKAMRSKHSVTEQRRRSKINERFQISRELIPNTDQKRDTASFLLEVTEYVQFLQEKVTNYESSYRGWSSEPTKLMPWRNNHWRFQSFVGQPQTIKNDSGPGSTFPGKLDENNINMSPRMITSALNPAEADPIRDATSKAMDQQPELANKGMPLSIRGDNVFGHPILRPMSEAQSTKCLISNDTSNQQDNLTIEGGTISISGVYSQGLLTSLTQALQSVGLDLSQANISVQIDLGKHSNRGLTTGTSAEEPQNSPVLATTHLRDMSSGEESDPVQKRLKK